MSLEVPNRALEITTGAFMSKFRVSNITPVAEGIAKV